MSSVLRTHPLQGRPEISVSGQGFSFRKRFDGGYTIAHGSIINYEVVPDSLSLGLSFLSLAWKVRKELCLRLSSRFGMEWKEPKFWSPDEPSPFEKMRILSPSPVRKELEAAVINLVSAYPEFGGLQVAEESTGMIDVTPDAVPVISGVPNLLGLFFATGFSGHGFGIGPAAGELAANLVTAEQASVDYKPFDLSRFSDGCKICLVAGMIDSLAHLR